MPDMGLTEILAIVGTTISAAGTGYSIYEQRSAQDQALQAQRQAQQQTQQQALSQRRQSMLAAGPTVQAQTSGFLTPASQQAMEAQVTHNPAIAAPSAGTSGSLTPAIEDLFPSGGVPSLTDPYPMNV